MQQRWFNTAVGMGLVLAAACKGSKTDRPVVTDTHQGEALASPAGTEVARRDKSLVRVVNAIPSKRAVDVASDDRTVFTSVPYKRVTPYAEIQSNRVKFRLRAAGGDSAQADNTETLADGGRYTIVALPDEHGGRRLIIITDAVVPDSGKARIRVVNAVPGLKNVDIAVQGQKDPLFKNVDYGDVAGEKDIDPMTATIEVRTKQRSSRPFVLKDMHLAAGKSYTIVLTGGQGQLQAVTFDDTMTQGTEDRP